jgi:phosphoribosylanthranilate isomerase
MVHVKICGITNAADAQAATEAGADFIGFNFYEKSPRYISPAEAAKIREQLPANVKAVGVFVNIKASSVAAVSESLRFDAAQLHGDETPEIAAAVSRTVPVIKVFLVEPEFRLGTFDEYPDAFAFLLDAAFTGQYGGTGHCSDWDVARQAATSRRIILAGGLKVENVAAAVRIVRPYAVDVASGVETRPGKKDRGLLREFIQEVRRAEKELGTQSENSRSA